MMKKYWLITLLSFLLLPFTMQGQQFEELRVAKIDVVAENLSPDMAFNSNTVRARMCTKVGGLFSQTDFDNDLKGLATEYDRIEPTMEIVGNEVYITLYIWFKPTIRSITFCGNERVKTKKLMKKLEIQPGSVFERDEFIKAFNQLKILYVKKGYFEAELCYETIPVGCDNQIDIQINICEGRAGKINKICFNGVSACEEEEILELMITKKYQFFLSWYTGRGTYHPDMIEHDRLQMINYFQNQGYADAMVDLCTQESTENRIMLVISVVKGQLYMFGDICFTGNTVFSDEEIRDLFQFGTRYAYSPEKIRCTAQAINDRYGACGYIDASVDIFLSLRENCPVYDVEVSIEEGEQYYVGLIKVFGNRCTQTNMILHESLLCPGEIFDNRKLQGTENRLLNTGFFSNVNVYAVRSQIEDPCGERQYRDVFIEVEETDTGNLSLFFGFSSLDRIFGGVEITERNFNIAGLTRVIQNGPGALRGGAEYAHAKINIGDKQTSYLLQWTKPYFMDTQWIVGVDLEKSDNRALSKAYEIKTYGGNVHGTYIINQYLKYDMHYRGRHTNVTTRGDNVNTKLQEQAEKTGFVSAAGFSFIYDSTDHPRRASCGFRSRLLYELAGLGGNYQFMKVGYFNSYYYPMSKKGTFKLRADLQFIKTYGHTHGVQNIPLSERLYLGGETTVRGYRNFIIGPKFANNEPAGGASSILVTEEYQYNLLKAPCLDGFVFVDAGMVTLSEFALGKYAASVGFGIRIEVMRNMPLMMGLGWPIHPGEKVDGQRVNNTQRFFFAIGGSF